MSGCQAGQRGFPAARHSCKQNQGGIHALSAMQFLHPLILHDNDTLPVEDWLRLSGIFQTHGVSLDFHPRPGIAAGKAINSAAGCVDIKRAAVLKLYGARVAVDVPSRPAQRVLPCPNRRERIKKCPAELLLGSLQPTRRIRVIYRTTIPAADIADVAVVGILQAIDAVESVGG